jgi:hypothetical protein
MAYTVAWKDGANLHTLASGGVLTFYSSTSGALVVGAPTYQAATVHIGGATRTLPNVKPSGNDLTKILADSIIPYELPFTSSGSYTLCATVTRPLGEDAPTVRAYWESKTNPTAAPSSGSYYMCGCGDAAWSTPVSGSQITLIAKRTTSTISQYHLGIAARPTEAGSLDDGVLQLALIPPATPEEDL